MTAMRDEGGAVNLVEQRLRALAGAEHFDRGVNRLKIVGEVSRAHFGVRDVGARLGKRKIGNVQSVDDAQRPIGERRGQPRRVRQHGQREHVARSLRGEMGGEERAQGKPRHDDRNSRLREPVRALAARGRSWKRVWRTARVVPCPSGGAGRPSDAATSVTKRHLEQRAPESVNGENRRVRPGKSMGGLPFTAFDAVGANLFVEVRPFDAEGDGCAGDVPLELFEDVDDVRALGGIAVFA